MGMGAGCNQWVGLGGQVGLGGGEGWPRMEGICFWRDEGASRWSASGPGVQGWLSRAWPEAPGQAHGWCPVAPGASLPSTQPSLCPAGMEYPGRAARPALLLHEQQSAKAPLWAPAFCLWGPLPGSSLCPCPGGRGSADPCSRPQGPPRTQSHHGKAVSCPIGHNAVTARARRSMCSTGTAHMPSSWLVPGWAPGFQALPLASRPQGFPPDLGSPGPRLGLSCDGLGAMWPSSDLVSLPPSLLWTQRGACGGECRCHE